MDKKTNRKRSSSQLKRLYKRPGALIITMVVLLVGAVLAVTFLLPKGERINTNSFQVVYTTSGQAYFGKLKSTGGEYLVLNTPYTAQDIKGEGENAQPSTTLLKVSQQQYGPEDVMSIKSDQVLFWQNIRSDSKVAQALRSNK